MRSLRIPLAVAVAAATVAALVGCSPSGDETAEDLSLVLPVDLIRADWDPGQGANAFGGFQYDAVYDYMLGWDWNTGTALPSLAEEWTIAEDRMSMELRLREDVDFVDGVHMDAAAVVKYYDALFERGMYLLKGDVGAYGPEFAATDEYTVEVTTTKPIYYPEFVRLLFAATPVLSPGTVDDPEGTKDAPVGSGPYVIDEIVPDVEITFVRNPDYWNPEAFDFDTVTLRVMTDATARLNALKSGQLDASALLLDQVADAEASGLTLNEGAGTYANLVVQNPADSPEPALRDVRVRQAISYAFDREAIAESLELGYGIVSSQAFVPGQPEYIEGGDDRYPYDVEKARELMAEAGYADGFDLVIPSGSVPGFGFTTPYEPIIQQSLAEIGIRVTYEPTPAGSEIFATWTSGNAPLYLFSPFDNVNTLRLLTLNAPTYGWLVVPTPELEEMVRVIKEGNEEESAAASQELGEFILEEAWYIPISRPAAFWGSAADVEVAMNTVQPNPALWDITAAS